jgi:hypothetical protein
MIRSGSDRRRESAATDLGGPVGQGPGHTGRTGPGWVGLLKKQVEHSGKRPIWSSGCKPPDGSQERIAAVVQVVEITLPISLRLSTSSFKDAGPFGDLLIIGEY